MNTKNYIGALAGAVILAGSAFAQVPDIAKIKADAEAGNAMAQAQYAQMLQTGNGVEKNEAEALKWYQKSAEAGNDYAQANMGVFCQTGGCGMQKDIVKAAEWYEKAAVQGNAYAQYYLARLYNFGTGVAQDAQKASEWYGKAAKGGMAVAQSEYAMRLAHGDGVAQNVDEALVWCEKSVKAGDAMGVKLRPLLVKMKIAMDAGKDAYEILQLFTCNDISMNCAQQDAIRDLYDGRPLLFRHVNVWHNNHGTDGKGSKRIGMKAMLPDGRPIYVYGNFSGEAKNGIKGVKEDTFIDVFGIVRKADEYGSEYGIYLEAIALDGKTDLDRIDAFLKNNPVKIAEVSGGLRMVDTLAAKTDLNPPADPVRAAKEAAEKEENIKRLLEAQQKISKERVDVVQAVATLASSDAHDLKMLFAQADISMNGKQAESVAKVYSGRYLWFANATVWHNNHGTDGKGSKRLGMFVCTEDGHRMYVYGNFSGDEKKTVTGIKADSKINIFGAVRNDDYGSESGVYLEALVLDGKTDLIRISKFLDATGFDVGKGTGLKKDGRIVDELAKVLDLDPPEDPARKEEGAKRKQDDESKLLTDQGSIDKNKVELLQRMYVLANRDAKDLQEIFAAADISMNTEQEKIVKKLYAGRCLSFVNAEVWHNNHGTDGKGSKRLGMAVRSKDGHRMYVYGNFSSTEKNAVRGIKSDACVNVFGVVKNDDYGSESGVYLEALVLDGKTDLIRILKLLEREGVSVDKAPSVSEKRIVEKLAKEIDLDPPK